MHLLYTKFREDTTSIKKIFENNQDISSLIRYLKINQESNKIDLLKLLARPFFSNYAGIRKSTLKWVIVELENTLAKINNDQVSDIYDIVNLFRYAKMLIKRLASLQSIFLIRTDTLEDIRIFYNKYKHQWRDKIIQEIKLQFLSTANNSKVPVQSTLQFHKTSKFKCDAKGLERLIVSLDNFNLHYADAVKSIVWDDEYKTLILERNLDLVEPGFRTGPAKSFHSLFRILRTENVNIFINFLDWIEVLFSKDSRFSFQQKNYEQDVDSIFNFLRINKLNKHYKIRPLLDYFIEDNNHIFENLEFINRIPPLILLKIYINKKRINDNRAGEARPKMEYILFLLCKIMDIEIAINGGAYCIANCGF